MSGLGKVAGSCARICLMAYTLFSSPRSLSSRSSWLRWSFPTSSSVQEFIGKSGSCICRSGFPPPRFNLPSAAAVSRTIRLLGERVICGVGLAYLLSLGIMCSPILLLAILRSPSNLPSRSRNSTCFSLLLSPASAFFCFFCTLLNFIRIWFLLALSRRSRRTARSSSSNCKR